jgi:hypothetical protein
MDTFARFSGDSGLTYTPPFRSSCDFIPRRILNIMQMLRQAYWPRHPLGITLQTGHCPAGVHELQRRFFLQNFTIAAAPACFFLQNRFSGPAPQ